MSDRRVKYKGMCRGCMEKESYTIIKKGWAPGIRKVDGMEYVLQSRKQNHKYPMRCPKCNSLITQAYCPLGGKFKQDDKIFTVQRIEETPA